MITLIRMKYKEWKLKLALYTVLEAVAAEQKDTAALLSRLYVSLKDVPLDELRGEFLGKLAEVIHERGDGGRTARGWSKWRRGRIEAHPFGFEIWDF